VEKLRQLPMLTSSQQQITLGMVATIDINDGAPMIRTENARLSGWVYIDVRDRDLASAVHDLQLTMSKLPLKPGVSIAYAGQFEYLQRANARLKVVVPATLAIIFVLLFFIFKRFDEAALIMLTLPFALTGGIWFLYVQGYNLSIATGVGFIALAGVAAEFGVVMLLYLKQSLHVHQRNAAALTSEVLDRAIHDGAVLRVRPKAMTVAVIIAGLVPIFFGEGAGSEVMSRIAAPMVGGMITAPLLSMLVIPAAYRLMMGRRV
jgi:Cu(I)/Ag(I) efflux system membrane protein CusA/SilA